MSRKRLGARNCSMMAVESDIRLWPAKGIIGPIEAVSMHDYPASCKVRCRDVGLIRASDKKLYVQEESTNSAVCCTNAPCMMVFNGKSMANTNPAYRHRLET
jgi:hypothetical protein